MFWDFMLWLRERRCLHDFKTVGFTPVSPWAPQTFTNYSVRPVEHAFGATRYVRAHMQCSKCEKRMLSQALETSIAGNIHSINLHNWDAMIINSRK